MTIPKMKKLFKDDIIEESTHLGVTRYTKYADFVGNRTMFRIDVFSPESTTDDLKWITAGTEYEEVLQARVFNYPLIDVLKKRLQAERFKRVTEMMSREYWGIWERQ